MPATGGASRVFANAALALAEVVSLSSAHQSTSGEIDLTRTSLVARIDEIQPRVVDQRDADQKVEQKTDYAAGIAKLVAGLREHKDIMSDPTLRTLAGDLVRASDAEVEVARQTGVTNGRLGIIERDIILILATDSANFWSQLKELRQKPAQAPEILAGINSTDRRLALASAFGSASFAKPGETTASLPEHFAKGLIQNGTEISTQHVAQIKKLNEHLFGGKIASASAQLHEAFKKYNPNAADPAVNGQAFREAGVALHLLAMGVEDWKTSQLGLGRAYLGARGGLNALVISEQGESALPGLDEFLAVLAEKKDLGSVTLSGEKIEFRNSADLLKRATQDWDWVIKPVSSQLVRSTS